MLCSEPANVPNPDLSCLFPKTAYPTIFWTNLPPPKPYLFHCEVIKQGQFSHRFIQLMIEASVSIRSCSSLTQAKHKPSSTSSISMDSIKSFKGYGKVDGAEDREFKRKARRRLILIVISAIVLVAIIIGILIAVVANKGDGDDGPEHDNSPSSISNSIKAMCSVTQYPDSCFTSISSVMGSNLTSDPEELFRLSLQVASDALSKLTSLPDTVTVMSNDKRLKAVIKDCKDLFDDAVEQLQDSISLMRPKDPNKKLLTESKINDLKTWLSAAITNQETCLDGFEGTRGDLHDKFEAAMANATQFTSNSLAIAARIHGILKDLNFQLHRKLLSTRGTGQFPEWITGSQRRALLQAPSELGSSNVTVAQDGTGQVKTIKEAIAMVPLKSLSPFVIYVKAGVYEENVVIEKSKWNVHIYGDGMYKTIVSGSLNFVDGTPTFSTATFAVVGKGFMARDMGFKNTAGPEKHQAVAFRSGSDQSVYYRCAFDAYQDTLYAHAMRQFYRECDVTGTVDFIFGDAAVVFQKCTIRPRQPLPNQQNIITAQGKKDPNEDTGIVIQDCTITSSPDVTAPTYLGRPWKNYSTTMYLQSDIGAVVDQTGWLSWIPGTDPPTTINYGEFQNTGPGSNVAGRVKWAGYNPAVSAEEAAQYTVHAFLEGAEWIAQKGVTYDSTL